MPSLHEVQLGFAQELFAENTAARNWIRANGLSSACRLQVYRNNLFSSLTETLRAVYPVIERLTGERFFPYAANEYIHCYPSRSGNLHDFGDRFGEFLADFEPTAKLHYLPDVAALEWAYHRVFHAAEHGAPDIAALQQTPPEFYGELHFQLHPTARLLRSEYPILRIWQVNQDDFQGDPAVDLTAGADRLLIIRRGLDIEIQPLDSGEYALLAALAEGQNFAEACAQAQDIQADYDLASNFRQHIVQATLVDFYL